MATSSADYGIPPRPPTASTALWTHLMRPGAQLSAGVSQPDISSLAPPAKPLDKNAASMRILLHDAQAHFDKFTVHAGQLVDGVKEARHDIKSVQGLYERDRESLVGDIIDLVNRTQTEIQKSVGAPAQASALENGIKDITHRLVSVEQRLDTIQASNHAHTQMLQTQAQATQMLLDKQGAILAAVAPILPLIQAVPLHMDSMKAYIHETLAIQTSEAAGGRDRIRSPTHDRSLRLKRKRTDTEHSTTTPMGAISSNARPLKRLRMGSSSPSPLAPQRTATATSRQQHLHHSHSRVASPLARTGSATSTVFRQKSLTPGQQQQQQQSHATLRRPLTDLPLPPADPAATAISQRRATPPRPQLPQRTPEGNITHAGSASFASNAVSPSMALGPSSARLGAQNRTPAAVAGMCPSQDFNMRAVSDRESSASTAAPTTTTTTAAAAAPPTATVDGRTPHARPPRILRMHASFGFANSSVGVNGAKGMTTIAAHNLVPIPMSIPAESPMAIQAQAQAQALDLPAAQPQTARVLEMVQMTGSGRSFSPASPTVAAEAATGARGTMEGRGGEVRSAGVEEGTVAKNSVVGQNSTIVKEKSIDITTEKGVAGTNKNGVSQASGARGPVFTTARQVLAAARSVIVEEGVGAEESIIGERGIMTAAQTGVVGPAQGSPSNRSTESVRGPAPVRTTDKNNNKVSQAYSARIPFFPLVQRRQVAEKSTLPTEVTVIGPAQRSRSNAETRGASGPVPVLTTARKDKNQASRGMKLSQPFYSPETLSRLGLDQRAASVASSASSSLPKIQAPSPAPAPAVRPTSNRPTTRSTANAGAGQAQNSLQPQSTVTPGEVARLDRNTTPQMPLIKQGEAKPGRRFIPIDDSDDENSADSGLSSDFSSF